MTRMANDCPFIATLTVQKVTGIAPTQQALIFRFKELAPALPLGSYKIPVTPCYSFLLTSHPPTSFSSLAIEAESAEPSPGTF